MISTYFILGSLLFVVQNWAAPLTSTEQIDTTENPTQSTSLNQYMMQINNMTVEQKAVMDKFLAGIFFLKDTPKEQEKTIRKFADLHREHPEVYVILRPNPTGINEIEKNKSIKNFLKFYYDRIDAIKSGNDQEFNSFLKDVRVEWKKLDKNEQSEIAKEAKTVVQMINGE